MSGRRLTAVYCGAESFVTEDVPGDELALRVHDAVASVDAALAASLEFDPEAGGFAVAAGGLRALRRVFAIAVDAGLIVADFAEGAIHRDEVDRVPVGSGSTAEELRAAPLEPTFASDLEREPRPPSDPQWAVWASGHDWAWGAHGLLTAAPAWADREATDETTTAIEELLAARDPERAASVRVGPSWADGEIAIGARTRADLRWAAAALGIELRAPSADDVLRLDLVDRLAAALQRRPIGDRKLVGVALTLERRDDGGVGVELAIGSERSPRGTTHLTARELQRTFRPTGPRATVHPVLVSGVGDAPEDPAIARWRAGIDQTPIRGLVAPPEDVLHRLWVCVISPALAECFHGTIRDLPEPHPVWVLWTDHGGHAGWDWEFVSRHSWRDPDRVERIRRTVIEDQHRDPLPQPYLYGY